MDLDHCPAEHQRCLRVLTQLGISEQQAKAAQKHFKTLNVHSGEILLRQGDTQTHAYFIDSGVLKACHYASAGTALSKEFYFQHELCFLYCSWLTQDPAKYQLESIEDAVVIQLPLFLLSQTDWQQVKITLLSQQLIYKEQKEEFFLLNTPEQRYQYLVKNRPLWINKLNNIQLASYIGISPVSLSRLKSRLPN